MDTVTIPYTIELVIILTALFAFSLYGMRAFIKDMKFRTLAQDLKLYIENK
jgi:hypothetical protein